MWRLGSLFGTLYCNTTIYCYERSYLIQFSLPYHWWILEQFGYHIRFQQ